MPSSIAHAAPRRKPLAAAVASLFVLSTPLALATTFVTNCNDGGPGSLRVAVSTAAEGDTVDATGLTSASTGCSLSRITLNTGGIAVTQNNLTINGPGVDVISVQPKYKSADGNTMTQYFSRVFNHSGTGTLAINDLKMAKGYLKATSGTLKGGCIYSKGTVSLNRSEVYACTLKHTGGAAYGGGVFTTNTLIVSHSTIKYNKALSGTSAAAAGGGAYVLGGTLLTSFASITNNSAKNTANTGGLGGGINTMGPSALIFNSTFSANSAGASVGALFARSSSLVDIVNSTISGNAATTDFVGGVYANTNNLVVYNSTIANNTSGANNTTFSPGFAAVGSGTAPTAKLESTIISGNSFGSPKTESDANITLFGTFTGHNNLVQVPTGSFPSDTIVGECPLLGPLRNNGGETQTRSLRGHSPAIDTGNDTEGSSSDQRGTGFPRSVGPPGGAALTDIGAFEVNRLDEIFDVDFEGCP